MSIKRIITICKIYMLKKNNEMINSINIQIRETNTDDFDSIMTVEKTSVWL